MSYKVIIADDEPLVLIGLQDLINWQSEGFELVAQARNGQMLSQAIEEHNPDLVITDIKMPVKSGLDVMQEEKEKGKKLPLFIFLTSFEEFDLIKKAMSLEAVDYIVKLELDKAQLIQALDRAKKKIDDHTKYNVLFNNCHRFSAGCITGNFDNEVMSFAQLEETILLHIEQLRAPLPFWQRVKNWFVKEKKTVKPSSFNWRAVKFD